jgi:Spy/CpxP family protein refolding chaperone
MRSSILKFILLVSLALNISVIGTAGYFHYKQSGYWTTPFGNKIEKDRFLFEELSLRPEQLKEMKSRAMQFRSEIDRRRHEITQKRRELISLIRMDAPDINAIDMVISKINIMQGEMQKKIAVHILEEKALLDKSQQEKFLNLIENAMTQGGQIGCPLPTEHD